MKPLSRRKFILSLAGAAGGTAVLLISTRHAVHRKLTIHITELLPNPDAAHEAGRLYLRRYPKEHDPDYLIDHLLPNYLVYLFNIDDQKLHIRLHDKIRHDFVKEQVVSLDGWMLSRTEARLYTLVHLALEESG